MREIVTASQAAEILGVDKRTVLRFARDGKLRSYRTPGGQHRFRQADVERLASGDGDAPRLSTSTLQTKRDEIDSLNLEVQARRAKRELARVEAEDAEADRQQVQARVHSEQERARAEQERRAAERQERAERRERAERHAHEKQRRTWENEWIAGALRTLPADVPFDVKASVQRSIREALADWTPGDSPDTIAPFVRAAQNDALRPWEANKETERAVFDALDKLPFAIRQIRLSLRDSPLNDWEARAVREARQAIRALPAESSVSEIRAAAAQVVKKLTREYEQGQAQEQHRDVINQLLFFLRCDEERAAVQQALERLPIGCGRSEMERAKDAALAPIRERGRAAQEARSNEIAAQVQAQIDRSRAEAEADRLLRYVGDYIEEIGGEKGEWDLGNHWERYRLAEEIKEELRSKFISLLLHGELSADEASELIEEYVNREI
jgi:excisionase family DNA binding protein